MSETDHSHYINAVADHLKRAGVAAASMETGREDDLRTARLVLPLKRDDDPLAVGWSDQDGWEWGWADPDDGLLYDGDELYCEPLDAPALVVAALLYDCGALRKLARAEIAADLEAALAEYAPREEPGPRPGQQVRDRDGDLWTYVDTGGEELRLISDCIEGVHHATHVKEEWGPLTPVEDVELPAGGTR
jgi:hypothetical protein